MPKTLWLVPLLLLLAVHGVFGQTAPLVSDPASQPAPVVIKKARSVALDIPLLPMRKTIHIGRIRDGNLDLGSTLEPWGKNVVHLINLAPELEIITSPDNRFHVAGGFARARDEGRRREDSFLDVAVDRRVWKLSAGVSSFAEGEDIDDVFEIVDLTAGFSRLSLGARAWSGVKTGSFSGNFFTLNLGGGYFKTRGGFKFRHPVLADIDPVELYREDFGVYTLTVEGRKTHRRISLHGKLDGMRYSGQSVFNDLNVRGTVEMFPLLRFNAVRVLVKGSSSFQKYDSLLFRTGEPELQVYLRIKIR